MKRYLKDMDHNEKKNLIENCETLFIKLTNRAWDFANHWIKIYMNN